MRLLLLVFLSISVPAFSQSDIPIETNAVISDQLTREQVMALAQMVRISGYRCDSIAGARPWLFSFGFTLHCNGFRYEYEISEPGGRWQVVPK